MDIPTELKPVIAGLSPEESRELEQIFKSFSATDEELQILLSESLESLIQILTTQEGHSSADMN